jgi:zinc and cadmium transporter
MQNSNIFHVIFFSIAGGVLSLLGGLALLRSKHLLANIERLAVPFAAGALLGAVFLDLIPEAIESSPASEVMGFTLVGVVAFFVLERNSHWFHHHHEEDSRKTKKAGLIILSDTVHNALDGVIIATAFLINVPTGIITAIAVASHEIPQEIGDFGVLLSRGLSKKRVLLINLLSALATTLSASIVFLVGSRNNLPVGALLGISAGFLLYIALSDLLPSIHSHIQKRRKLIDQSTTLFIIGILIVWGTITLTHSWLDVHHVDEAVPTFEDNSHSH